MLFILGLRGLTQPDKARRGMQLAALGMLLAIVGTLIEHEIVDYTLDRRRAGPRLGHRRPLGIWVPMTAMPQRIAISHAVRRAGGHAGRHRRVLHRSRDGGAGRAAPTMAALGFEVMFGSLTITGSFMAFGKLQELLPGRADHLQGPELRQRRSCSPSALVLFVWLIVTPGHALRPST